MKNLKSGSCGVTFIDSTDIINYVLLNRSGNLNLYEPIVNWIHNNVPHINLNVNNLEIDACVTAVWKTL